ncbi:hypothetical protein CERSUDRAFT_92913 [Gelatoporia subvermispora B]|uniref:Cation efflux protein transmembrane domain-containing protein n=1 Tax=Ceriporiopsis subvermispora (strain B) TaxID=914234 RepID=M2R2W4_CERS8|nr:hypothetical protein CERSUDRAFT_92913 [Gelatoporia subvermispora B]
MAAPDPRTRGKVALNPPSVRSTILPQLLFSDAVLVLALQAGKTYILDRDVGVFWLLVRVLMCGAVGSTVWLVASGQLRKNKPIEWSAVGASSLLLFLRHAGLITALYRLPSTRVIFITHFSVTWVRTFLSPTSLFRTAAVVLALLLSFLSDAKFSPQNFHAILPAYGALALEALSASLLEHTQGVLLPDLGQGMSLALSTLGAFAFSVPLYMLRNMIVEPHLTPTFALSALSVIPVLAYAALFQAPKLSRVVNGPTASSQYFLTSFMLTFVLSALSGILIFNQYPRWADLLVAPLLLYGMWVEERDATAPSPYAASTRVAKAYLKSILSNAESRKIFYFLMLNMCYMLVQMLYGVWTNSLGLISDAIHMAFDCMAIGIGLIASVMARWPPNERFTYGYGRIETLSGFANGIFLILISVFIVFEAVQRLLEPPEMNTSQLLLVSSLGLAVNLFGMFAMGGHHHGGHSHSHGHSHGHGHSHTESPPPVSPSEHASHSHTHSLDDGCDITDAHDHGHSHAHSRSHSYSPGFGHEPAHSHTLTNSHSHTLDLARADLHAHPHSHSHSPPPSPQLSHSHSHAHSSPSPEHTPSLTSSHSHSHSHSPPALPSHSVAHAHLHAHSPPEMSPVTPSYEFGHDAHFASHGAAHTPNLHDHAHIHEHAAHEGHSHNMRGVFLHVMAVRALAPFISPLPRLPLRPGIPSHFSAPVYYLFLIFDRFDLRVLVIVFDTLGSIGVIVSTLLIQWYGWTGFDPIASLFIAILIAASVVPLVIDTGKVLALDLDDRAPKISQALSDLHSVEGLVAYSEPRFWPKDSGSVIGSIHVRLAPAAGRTRVDRVVERVDRLLRGKIPGLEELTIQVEEAPVTAT